MIKEKDRGFLRDEKDLIIASDRLYYDESSNKVLTEQVPASDFDIVNKKYVDDSVEIENLWNRTGTTISPNTANDNVDIGTGTIFAGKGDLNGTFTTGASESLAMQEINGEFSGTGDNSEVLGLDMSIGEYSTITRANHSVYGLYFQAFAEMPTLTSIGLVSGITGDAINNGAGTVSNLRGGVYSARNLSTGIISDCRALSIQVLNSGGGIISTGYGLYIGTIAGTNNYGIYQTGNSPNILLGNITSPNFISNVAIGTSPYACTSTTLNTNLNADLWDGFQFADYLNQAVKTTSSPTFVNATLSGRTTGRIAYFTTGGAFTDSTNLTFNGTDAYISGLLGVGNTPVSYATISNYKNVINIGTGSWFGTYTRVDTTANVNGTNYVIGNETNLYSLMAISAGVTDSGYRVGMRAQAFPNTTDFAGTLTSLYGFWTRAGINNAANGAVITNAYGNYSEILQGPAGTTITNAYGVYINRTAGAGTITNLYGLYSADTSSRNYLAGNTAIGGVIYNANKVDVVSTSRSTAFDATNGATWHDIILYNGDTTANASVGINFKVGTHHSNAGTGIAAVKAAGDVYAADLAFITRPVAAVAAERMRILNNGRVGIGTTSPTANLHIKAGTATASTAPLKFTSGNLLSSAEAGAVEFLTDDYYATITTGTARKGIILNDGTNLTSSRVPFATTNGRLTDDADMTFTGGDTLNITKVIMNGQLRLKNYTVATLPAGTQGDIAYVTDALAPTFLGIIIGGGAVITPVFYNGTNWVGF